MVAIPGHEILTYEEAPHGLQLTPCPAGHCDHRLRTGWAVRWAGCQPVREGGCGPRPS